MFTAPSAGATFLVNTPVVFQATATDPEDGDMAGSSIRWRSLGADGRPFFTEVGDSISHTFVKGTTHQILVYATDSDGFTASALLEINIVTP